MKRIPLKAATFVAIMVLGSPSAIMAATTMNGLSANGLSANGLSANGLSANGLATNGLSANGLSPNGLSANGLSPNGLATNGWSPNGTAEAVNEFHAVAIVSSDGQLIDLR
jgi:hypothetical protein